MQNRLDYNGLCLCSIDVIVTAMLSSCSNLLRIACRPGKFLRLSLAKQSYHNVCSTEQHVLFTATLSGHSAKIDNESIVQLPCLFQDGHVEVPWHTVTSVWKEYSFTNYTEAVALMSRNYL